MKRTYLLSGVGALLWLLSTDVAQADPLPVVQDAERRVDHAWEVYHRAALGGTIASPTVQEQIERHLHAARTLVSEAQEAAERGDAELVDRLVQEIATHTTGAIEGSREHKP